MRRPASICHREPVLANVEGHCGQPDDLSAGRIEIHGGQRYVGTTWLTAREPSHSLFRKREQDAEPGHFGQCQSHGSPTSRGGRHHERDLHGRLPDISARMHSGTLCRECHGDPRENSEFVQVRARYGPSLGRFRPQIGGFPRIRRVPPAPRSGIGAPAVLIIDAAAVHQEHTVHDNTNSVRISRRLSLPAGRSDVFERRRKPMQQAARLPAVRPSGSHRQQGDRAARRSESEGESASQPSKGSDGPSEEGPPRRFRGTPEPSPTTPAR